MRLLSPSHFRRVPWKNGLGTTLELATDAAEPGGAWSWRLSVADVPARSAFSRFDGVDRRIAVLEGDGMELHSPPLRHTDLHATPLRAPEPLEAAHRETAVHTHDSEQVIAVPREGPAHAFRGEDPLEGAPLGAGVRDINLFFSRTAWTGAMRVVRGESPALSLRAGVSLAYLHQAPAPLRIEADGVAVELTPGSLAIASWIALPATLPATALVLARLDRARLSLGTAPS